MDSIYSSLPLPSSRGPANVLSWNLITPEVFLKATVGLAVPLNKSLGGNGERERERKRRGYGRTSKSLIENFQLTFTYVQNLIYCFSNNTTRPTDSRSKSNHYLAPQVSVSNVWSATRGKPTQSRGLNLAAACYLCEVVYSPIEHHVPGLTHRSWSASFMGSFLQHMSKAD